MNVTMSLVQAIQLVSQELVETIAGLENAETALEARKAKFITEGIKTTWFSKSEKYWTNQWEDGNLHVGRKWFTDEGSLVSFYSRRKQKVQALLDTFVGLDDEGIVNVVLNESEIALMGIK